MKRCRWAWLLPPPLSKMHRSGLGGAVRTTSSRQLVKPKMKLMRVSKRSRLVLRSGKSTYVIYYVVVSHCVYHACGMFLS